MSSKSSCNLADYYDSLVFKRYKAKVCSDGAENRGINGAIRNSLQLGFASECSSPDPAEKRWNRFFRGINYAEIRTRSVQQWCRLQLQ